MKFYALLLTMICSMASATSNSVQIESFPGKVKVLVDLNMSVAGQTDILFVMDNSGSMDIHQNNLAQNMTPFISELVNGGLDFHAGVVTTDMEYSKPGGRLIGTPAFFTPQTPNVATELARRLIVGTSGSAIEQVFAPVMAGLSEPLLSGPNAGFLRPSAQLALVVVTDAEDQSPQSDSDFIQFLTALKGDKSLVSVQGLIVPSNVNGCNRDQGITPARIENVINAFGGKEFSLCSPTLADDVKSLAQAIVNQNKSTNPSPVPGNKVSSVPLPSIPAFDTIVVKYGTQDITKGDLAYGWAYDPSNNSIVLGAKIPWSVQPADTPLEITYVPLDWVK